MADQVFNSDVLNAIFSELCSHTSATNYITFLLRDFIECGSDLATLVQTSAEEELQRTQRKSIQTQSRSGSCLGRELMESFSEVYPASETQEVQDKSQNSVAGFIKGIWREFYGSEELEEKKNNS